MVFPSSKGVMEPSPRSVRARDFWGVLCSATVTIAAFVVAPVCGLFWFVGGPPPIEVLLTAHERAPVELAWSGVVPSDVGDVDGEGGDRDADVAAGPDPTVGSQGDGSTEDIADASGDEGADDTTQQARITGNGPTGTASSSARTARGTRTQGAKGVSEMAARAAAGSARRWGRTVCKESHPDVDKKGEAAWVVNRKLVEYYTSNFKRFNSLGWSGPYENEELKGWKIGGFGCNSPLHFAGLRRGDVVLTINDKPTRNWVQVFGAYTRLRRNKKFEIVVVRRGKRKVLNYTLVDGGPPTTG